MPRMRTIKPDACTSETLSSVPRAVRWTFATFWTHCDDDGRAVWNLRLIKAALYPLDDDVTTDVLADEFAQLEAVGAVCRYESAGKQYIHVPAFGEHQHPNRRAASAHPPCPKTDHSVSTHAQRTEPSVNGHAQLTPVVVGEGSSSSRGDVVGSRAKTRGTRIPPDWHPDDELREWTLTRISQAVAAHELEKFRNYWAAKPGKDATKLDWPATWRNWVLTAIDRQPPRASPLLTAPDQRLENNAAVVRRLREQERS